MIEIWKTIPIEELDNRYMISNLGRIKRVTRKMYLNDGRSRFLKEKILSPHKHPKGYLIINLSHKDGSCTYKLHRLVAITFIPNPYNLPEVNHKDEDKTNNSVENLEWCTHIYNSNYGTRVQRILENRPSQVGRKLSEETKKKISLACLGKHHSDEWKANHSKKIRELNQLKKSLGYSCNTKISNIIK